MTNITYHVEEAFLPGPDDSHAKRLTQLIKDYLSQKNKLWDTAWEGEEQQ